jgi:predicted regulator of Ras-like GTPase activity (Roadblock/LC7/MglB family)
MMDSTGQSTAEHCGVINYLLEIGRAMGRELGLENLSEVQLYGKDSRILHTDTVDGVTSLVTTAKMDLKSVANKLREGLA